MRHALALARRNLGQTWPNPAVGAVVVKDGHIVGTGWTARGGRPHAEPQALAMAGARARGATLYVTLEPCAHHGKTPPCAETITKAGITRVVAACGDPYPEVAGRGIAMLRTAGIEVVENICRAEAEALNAGFFSAVTRGRPYVTLKLATSLDGHIATARGESQWITSESARAYGHLLRAEHDAILTGIGTVLADDPLLTCRLPGLEDRSPVRVVADSKLRLPGDSKLAQSARGVPLWVLHAGPSPARADGITYLACPAAPDGTLDLTAALRLLAERGITRLMVEAGSTLSTSFIKQNLVDRLCWLRAPLLLGGNGRGAVGPLHALPLAELARWKRTELRTLGPDCLETLEYSAI